MVLNKDAVHAALFAYDEVLDADKTTRGKLAAMLAALEAYEAEKARKPPPQEAANAG